MTPTEVAATLRQFNEWRRGDYEPSEQPAPPDPIEIGEAIDAAVEMIERLEATEEDRSNFLVEIGKLCAQCDALRLRIEAAEKERDALRAENERIDEAMESLLIRCDDSDSAMYGTLSTSFVRDTVRIARGAMEESK